MARRAPKLDDELIGKVDLALRTGNWFVTACALCGVPKSTGYYWRERGAADLEAGDDTTPYAKWELMCERASAAAESVTVASLQKAARAGDSKAAMFLLTHRYPKRWKPPALRADVRADVRTQGGGPPASASDAAALHARVAASLALVAGGALAGGPGEAPGEGEE